MFLLIIFHIHSLDNFTSHSGRALQLNALGRMAPIELNWFPADGKKKKVNTTTLIATTESKYKFYQ